MLSSCCVECMGERGNCTRSGEDIKQEREERHWAWKQSRYEQKGEGTSMENTLERPSEIGVVTVGSASHSEAASPEREKSSAEIRGTDVEDEWETVREGLFENVDHEGVVTWNEGDL